MKVNVNFDKLKVVLSQLGDALLESDKNYNDTNLVINELCKNLEDQEDKINQLENFKDSFKNENGDINETIENIKSFKKLFKRIENLER